MLDEASRILAASRDYRAALAQIARASLSSLGDWCLVECVEDGALARIAVAHRDPMKSAEANDLPPQRPLPPDWVPGPGRVVRNGRADVAAPASPAALAGENAEPEHLALVQELGVGAYVSVPLAAHDRTFGAITFVAADPARRYSPEDVALAEDLGGQAGAAIETAHLYDAEQRARRAVEALAERTGRLYEVTAALSGALTPERVAEVIVGQGSAALGAAAGLVALTAPDGKGLEIVAALGYPATQLEAWRRFDLDTRLPLSDVARTGRPLFLPSPDAFGVQYPSLARLAAQSTYRAWAALPLLVEGRPIGALGYSFTAPRDFEPSDRDFMHALVNQCALALERARLYEAEQRARSEGERANARLALLAEAGSLLAGSLDYERTLESVARLAVSRLADWCVVCVVEDDLTARSVVVAHRDPEMEEWARRNAQLYSFGGDPSAGPATVIRTGRSELVPEISDAALAAGVSDPSQLEMVRRASPRSYMGVPLKTHERVLGALAFISGTAGRYGPADLALAEELGRRAATAIENASLYKEAQEARRIGEEVLAMASHDLKSPLSAIMLNTHLMRSGPSENAERAAASIERSAGQMNRLIRDLLDMARIKGGRLTLERGTYECDALVQEVVDMLRPAIEQRGQRVEVVMAPGSGGLICDRERVVQILSNLLDNAIRFTPTGGYLTVRVEGRDAAEGRSAEVQFAVEDTGPGIAPEHLPHIFDRYWQPVGASPKGGLGLYIARELVKAHGGRLWAESTPGVGSTFYFALPVATEASQGVRVPADA